MGLQHSVLRRRPVEMRRWRLEPPPPPHISTAQQLDLTRWPPKCPRRPSGFFPLQAERRLRRLAQRQALPGNARHQLVCKVEQAADLPPPTARDQTRWGIFRWRLEALPAPNLKEPLLDTPLGLMVAVSGLAQTRTRSNLLAPRSEDSVAPKGFDRLRLGRMHKPSNRVVPLLAAFRERMAKDRSPLDTMQAH